jgi:tape measure domain-containing protein
MRKSMAVLTRSVLAYFSIRTAINIIKQADAYAILDDRIRTATKATGDYAEVQQQLYNITQKNGQAFDVTVALFQSLTRSAPELKATNSEVLTLVNLVEQLGVISGASQASQRAGLLQFTQGLASGVFRAEEFNSLLENIPELANRIAKGLGVSVGELRRMVIDGKLLSKDVFDSLLKQSEQINSEFAELPERIARSSEKLSTSFTNMISQLDKASHTTGAIAYLMNEASLAFDAIAKRLGESDLEEAQRKRAEAGLRYTQLTQAGISRQSAEVQRLLRLIDELDKKIIRLSKEEIALKEAAEKNKPAAAPDAAPVNENQEAIDKLTASLKENADTFGLSKEQIELYRLELLDATPAELKLAQAFIATAEAKKQHDDVMEAGKRVYEETRTEQEKLANELSRLNKLYEEGAFGAVGSAEALDTLARATFDLDDKFNELADTGESAFERLTAATRGWGQQFTNTLAEAVQQGKLDFSALVDSIISDLLRIAIFQGFTAPLFGGLGIPGFGAPVQHAGGMAGSGPIRNVNPFIFAGAQRYHSGGMVGLRSDEVPAILQRGELVLSKDQVGGASASGGGGTVRVEIENKGAPVQATAAGSSTDINGQVIHIVLDDINRGGRIRGAIKTVSNE